MFCIVLQQTDESAKDIISSQVRTDRQGGAPFQVAVQVLGCDDQYDHYQETPEHKEEGKDGLADPEDL